VAATHRVRRRKARFVGSAWGKALEAPGEALRRSSHGEAAAAANSVIFNDSGGGVQYTPSSSITQEQGAEWSGHVTEIRLRCAWDKSAPLL
jgi:hypothetical protein